MSVSVLDDSRVCQCSKVQHLRVISSEIPRGRGCENGKQGSDFTGHNVKMMLPFGPKEGLSVFTENTANNSCA